ncbi:hypothetical protein C5167_023873 [Papaver somniferum]|uniref:Uncharacterized protein n=1 Tax=Papaver somniferum TaxID=3469 RepID=A0A4Y7JNG0_PAPSO|nr:hypothetical protein C5167_023873 [Papaver somniferum]
MKKMKLMVRNYKKKIEFVSELKAMTETVLLRQGMNCRRSLVSPSPRKMSASPCHALLQAFLNKVEEFAETLVSKLDRSWKKGICKTYRMQNSHTVEDNGEEHEEHGTQEEEDVDVDVDSIDGAIVTILFDNGYSHGGNDFQMNRETEELKPD